MKSTSNTAPQAESHIQRLGEIENYYVTDEKNSGRNGFHNAILKGDIAVIKKIFQAGADVSIPTASFPIKFAFDLCAPSIESKIDKDDFIKRLEIFKLIASNYKRIKTILLGAKLSDNEVLGPILRNGVELSFKNTKDLFARLNDELKIVDKKQIEEINSDVDEIPHRVLEFYKKIDNPYLLYMSFIKRHFDIQKEVRDSFLNPTPKNPKKPSKNYTLETMIYGAYKDSEYLASAISSFDDYFQTRCSKISPSINDDLYFGILQTYCQRLNSLAILEGKIDGNFLKSKEKFPTSYEKNLINASIFLQDFEGLKVALKFSPCLNQDHDGGLGFFDLMIVNGINNSRNSPSERLRGVYEMIFCGADYGFAKSHENSKKILESMIDFLDGNSLEIIEEFKDNLEILKEFKDNLLQASSPTKSNFNRSDFFSKLEQMAENYLEMAEKSDHIKNSQISDAKTLTLHSNKFFGENGYEKNRQSSPQNILNFSGFLNYIKDFGLYEYLQANKSEPICQSLLSKVNLLSESLSKNSPFSKLREDFKAQNNAEMLLAEEVFTEKKSTKKTKTKKKSQVVNKDITVNSSSIMSEETVLQVIDYIDPNQQASTKICDDIVESVANDFDQKRIFISRLDDAQTQTAIDSRFAKTQTDILEQKSISTQSDFDQKLSQKTQENSCQTLEEVYIRPTYREMATQTDNLEKDIANSDAQTENIQTHSVAVATPYFMIKSQFERVYEFSNIVKNSDINALRLLQQDLNLDKSEIYLTPAFNSCYYPLNHSFYHSSSEFFSEFYQCCEPLLDTERIQQLIITQDIEKKNSLFYLVENKEIATCEKIKKIDFVANKLNHLRKWAFFNQRDIQGFKSIDYALKFGDNEIALNLLKNGVEINDPSHNIILKLYSFCNFDLMKRIYDEGLFRFCNISQAIISEVFQNIEFHKSTTNLESYQQQNIKNFEVFIKEKISEEQSSAMFRKLRRVNTMPNPQIQKPAGQRLEKSNKFMSRN